MNDLLQAIKARGSKQTEFAYGIITADAYVKTLQDCVGLSACYRLASKGHTSFSDLIRKAAQTLVYSSPDMVIEEKRLAKESYGKEITIDLPKNTLMSFRHVLTSSTKDRDGDVLHSDGAKVDPNMLLLWQHVHTLPIGKMIQVVDQNSKNLTVVSAIVDMNELCHDSAVMIDNGMGRFSHGFKAVEFTETKADRHGRGGGFNVTQFEIMEESLVSVPANVDAQTEEVLLSLVEGGKLTSPMMKRVGKGIRSRRNIQVPGVSIKYREQAGELKKELVCNSITDLKAAVDAGLIGSDKGGPGSGPHPGNGQENSISFRSGDRVNHPKFGEGIVQSVDTTTYSIPMVVVKFDAGKIARPATELTSVGKGKNHENQPGSGSPETKGTGEGNGNTQPSEETHDTTHEEKATSDAKVMCPDCEEKVTPDEDGKCPDCGLDLTDTEEPKTNEKPMMDMGKSVDWIDSKPFPNEHAARMQDPGKYEKLRRQNDKFGPGVHAIFGILDDGKTELQSIHFDRSQFTAEEAKKWLKDHKYPSGSFEEAVSKETELTGEKLGRVLSLANEKKIKEAKDHVDEVHGSGDMIMAHKAMLRIASENLKGVLGSLGEPDQAEMQKPLDVKTAIGLVLAEATPAQRKHLAKTLKAIEEVEQRNQQVKQYQALVR